MAILVSDGVFTQEVELERSGGDELHVLVLHRPAHDRHQHEGIQLTLLLYVAARVLIRFYEHESGLYRHAP